MRIKKHRTLLIDGDILAYQCSAAVEHPVDWGNGIWTLHAIEGEGVQFLSNKIEQIRTHLAGDSMYITLSPASNFRHRIYPPYKSNRKNTRRPLILPVLREWIKNNYDTYQRPDMEADDVLGVLSTSPHIIEGEKVIVSLDKDLKTIPGLICDTRTWDIQTITEPQANRAHMLQTLTGDATDGYPGCPGVGPKTAEKILQDASDYHDTWPLVVEAFQKKGLSEHAALIQAQIARICRRGDYDFKRKKVIPWEPSTTTN